VTSYPPLDVWVATPRLELRGATDELLERLVPAVRANKGMADPAPWDDPHSFYDPDPDRRVHDWLRAIWRGRGTVNPDHWRLYFVVLIDDEPVGTQDLMGDQFATFGTVETTSWVSSDVRGRGYGTEMRAAILHLAFEGFGAREASSVAAVDNVGSNRVSERNGYERNGTTWATHNGEPVLGQRWLLRRDTWLATRRSDITMGGVEDCRATLDLPRAWPLPR
jgi:RimJ/RimL family protein N-acetyltransferase